MNLNIFPMTATSRKNTAKRGETAKQINVTKIKRRALQNWKIKQIAKNLRRELAIDWGENRKGAS